MKQFKPAFAALILLFALAVPAFAAGGDTLISLSYLRDTFRPQIVKTLRSNADTDPTQQRYKEGDTLRASTGCEVIVLAGTVSCTGGTLVNATDGTEGASTLAVRARNIAAEPCTLTVQSPTAVICISGAATVAESTAPDYQAMADALHALSLLRGTGTGYGSGYDLELRPTRVEAMVMFIRLLGEEEDALACTAPQHFSDVPRWADRYVAYAYQRGYTDGVGAGRFAPARVITAPEYVEFLLRALGYSSTAHTNLSDTLKNAVSATLINDTEHDRLTASTLLRAHLVYISYYALDTPVKSDGRPLAEHLTQKGVFSVSDLERAYALVHSARW